MDNRQIEIIKRSDTEYAVNGYMDTERSATFTIAMAKAHLSNADITIDCEGLEYISSSGLRAFLSLRKRLGDHTVHLIKVQSNVYETFQIVGFDSFLDIDKPAKSC